MKKSGAKPQSEGPSKQPATPTPPAPMTPRRGVFWGLLIGFFAWIGVLLGLYFNTVYPQRYPSTGAATRPGASGLPSAPR